MAREKLLPFLIRNCDEGNFWDMWWYDEPGVICFDWTRQGNAAWHPPAVAAEWARQKSNLRDKKPRDLKAGLRNALDKKKELEKCKFSKQVEERDGRKFKFWKFKDLESERENIKNPSSKNEQKKKITKKNLHSQQDFEESIPHCSSTSDFKHRNPKSVKTLDKAKSLRKKGGRRKMTCAKHVDNIKNKQHPKHLREGEQENASSLPPISALFGGRMQGTSPPLLQCQTISSTYCENWFRDTSEFQPPQFFSSGPTPPPQINDVELPEYFNFKASPDSSTQQWYPTQHGNYPLHVGFPVNKEQVQNIPHPSAANFMATPSFYQTPQLTTSASTHPYLNLQDMDERYPSVQQNETRIQDVPIDTNSVLLQSEEVMNSEFLSNEFDYQLFDAVLNGLQLDSSVTDVHVS